MTEDVDKKYYTIGELINMLGAPEDLKCPTIQLKAWSSTPHQTLKRFSSNYTLYTKVEGAHLQKGNPTFGSNVNIKTVWNEDNYSLSKLLIGLERGLGNEEYLGKKLIDLPIKIYYKNGKVTQFYNPEYAPKLSIATSISQSDRATLQYVDCTTKKGAQRILASPHNATWNVSGLIYLPRIDSKESVPSPGLGLRIYPHEVIVRKITSLKTVDAYGEEIEVEPLVPIPTPPDNGVTSINALRKLEISEDDGFDMDTSAGYKSKQSRSSDMRSADRAPPAARPDARPDARPTTSRQAEREQRDVRYQREQREVRDTRDMREPRESRAKEVREPRQEPRQIHQEELSEYSDYEEPKPAPRSEPRVSDSRSQRIAFAPRRRADI